MDIVPNFHIYLIAERRVAQNTFTAYKKDLEQLIEFLQNRNLILFTARPQDLKDFIESLVNSNIKDRKSTRLNSSHRSLSRMPSSA